MNNLFLAVLIGLAPATVTVLGDTEYHFIEQNGALTTDLPGATITSNPSIPGGEGWDITFPLGSFGVGAFGFPDWLAEPPSEPGLVNSVVLATQGATSAMLHWESDIVPPDGIIISPSPTTYHWFMNGVGFDVTFEDLGDGSKPSGGVPDGGSSAALLGCALAACIGVRKRFTG
jgi:hypothetical protein